MTCPHSCPAARQDCSKGKDMGAILETAILEMGRRQGKQSFCPSKVVQWVFPQAWPYFMPDIKEAMMQLYLQGNISVSQSGRQVAKDSIPEGPVEITLCSKT